MIKNYFFLYRCAEELNVILANETIYEIYTHEKNVISFKCSNQLLPNRHLIASIDQTTPYLYLKNEFYKAKRNTANFFAKYLPSKIIRIQIADKERIIKISLEHCSLFYFLRGSSTNLFMIDKEQNILSFRKESNEILELRRNELLNISFIEHSEGFHDSFNLKTDMDSFSTFKHSFPYAGKELYDEISFRQLSSPQQSIQILAERIIQEIFLKKIIVYYDDYIAKPVMKPITFSTYENNTVSKAFDNFNEALNEYIILSFKKGKSVSHIKEIERHLDRELSRLSTKLNNLKQRIELGSKDILYAKYANLLLANRHLLKKGLKKILLSDFESESKFEILLDEKLSPHQNIDKYFEKVRDEKVNFAKSIELFSANNILYKKFLSIKNKLDNELTVDELLAIKKELKMKDDSGKKTIKEQIRYRHFVLEDKFDIYVGKDSASNDLLTTQFAKQNDFWFHARGLPGSHVVLRVNNPKEGIPKNILKTAASIAAYYSKGKTSGLTPVSYTFRKYVHKKKGLAPGQVLLDREEVLLVRPEIPQNCVEISDE